MGIQGIKNSIYFFSGYFKVSLQYINNIWNILTSSSIHSLIPFIQVFHVQLNHCLINSEKETNIYTAMSAVLAAFSCTIYTQERKKSILYRFDLESHITPKIIRLCRWANILSDQRTGTLVRLWDLCLDLTEDKTLMSNAVLSLFLSIILFFYLPYYIKPVPFAAIKFMLTS